MADPRDTARQWLAERLHGAQCSCAFRDGRCLVYGILHPALVDAILSVPGVEVGTERYRDLGDPAEVRIGVVIRLPKEVAGDG